MIYMHAKLAADIVQTASKSRHNVYLQKGELKIDAKSILGVLSLVDTDNIVVKSEDQEIVEAITTLLQG